MAATQPNESFAPGRLKTFGITKAFHLPLLLPKSWDDLTLIVRDFTALRPGELRICIAGISTADPKTFTTNRKAVRMKGFIRDANGVEISVNAFGNTRELQQALKLGSKVVLQAKVEMFDNRLQLSNPELVDDQWQGQLRPRYTGKPGYLNAATVRDKINEQLIEQIPHTAHYLRDHYLHSDETSLLAAFNSVHTNLEKVLYLAHRPRSVDEGLKAQQLLDRLAAHHMLHQSKIETQNITPLINVPQSRLPKRLLNIPFTLTQEQLMVVNEILSDMNSNKPMQRALLGDVGTGKTCCYALAAACASDSGGHVAIILPSATLARQIFDDFKGWFKDIDIKFISAQSDHSNQTSNSNKGAIHIGTTALLFNNPTIYSLVISDEEHKFGAQQRQHLVASGAHALSATATCVPRTQALVEFGFVNVSTLKKSHVIKNITTRLRTGEEKRDVFNSVKKTVAKGDRVLIIYPKIDGSENERNSVSNAKKLWEKAFPNRVRMVHSRMEDNEKRCAIEALSNGEADILVATTAVEVGVNILRLTQAIVVDAEKFGLVSLHQIRGRVARQGGEGQFDLLFNPTATTNVTERLNVLVEHSSGFEIAKRDLQLRGGGNLATDSNQQSGQSDSFLLGRSISHDDLEYVMAAIC